MVLVVTEEQECESARKYWAETGDINGSHTNLPSLLSSQGPQAANGHQTMSSCVVLFLLMIIIIIIIPLSLCRNAAQAASAAVHRTSVAPGLPENGQNATPRRLPNGADPTSVPFEYIEISPVWLHTWLVGG